MVSIISITVLITINITELYKFTILKYDLTSYTGLSQKALLNNYNTIIYYIQNPLINKLNLKDFTMSNFGRIHFQEVKEIFLGIIILSIIFMFLMVILLILDKKYDRKGLFLSTLNKSVNIIIILISIISIGATFNFSKSFKIFHQIFFRNNYWIFDERIDPVIKALPMEFFMIEFISIVFLLVIFSLCIKVLYFIKYKNRKSIYHNL